MEILTAAKAKGKAAGVSGARVEDKAVADLAEGVKTVNVAA